MGLRRLRRRGERALYCKDLLVHRREVEYAAILGLDLQEDGRVTFRCRKGYNYSERYQDRAGQWKGKCMQPPPTTTRIIHWEKG